MKRVHISGVPIDVITAEDAAQLTFSRLGRGVRTSVAAVNAAIVVMATRDPTFREALRDFDLLIADGMWAAVAATCVSRGRVPYTNTSPFIRALFRQFTPRGLRVYLLGAKPDVVERASVRLPRLYPAIRVVGHEHGYFRAEDELSIVERVNASSADVLLIGISSPKKELFIRRYWSQLNVSMAFGIGGLIDIWAGQTREAPYWIKNCGLEWLFRLVQEPRRLWRRYTVDNIYFLRIVFKQALGIH